MLVKIIRNILFLLIVSFIIIGCEKKENLVLECTTTIKDTKERVQIKFFDSNTTARIVTVKKDKDYKQKIESIKQNCKSGKKNVKILLISVFIAPRKSSCQT